MDHSYIRFVRIIKCPDELAHITHQAIINPAQVPEGASNCDKLILIHQEYPDHNYEYMFTFTTDYSIEPGRVAIIEDEYNHRMRLDEFHGCVHELKFVWSGTIRRVTLDIHFRKRESKFVDKELNAYNMARALLQEYPYAVLEQNQYVDLNFQGERFYLQTRHIELFDGNFTNHSGRTFLMGQLHPHALVVLDNPQRTSGSLTEVKLIKPLLPSGGPIIRSFDTSNILKLKKLLTRVAVVDIRSAAQVAFLTR